MIYVCSVLAHWLSLTTRPVNKQCHRADITTVLSFSAFSIYMDSLFRLFPQCYYPTLTACLTSWCSPNSSNESLIGWMSTDTCGTDALTNTQTDRQRLTTHKIMWHTRHGTYMCTHRHENTSSMVARDKQCKLGSPTCWWCYSISPPPCPHALPSQHTDNEVPRGLSQKAELTDLTLHHWMLTLEENRVKLASGDIMMHHDLIKLWMSMSLRRLGCIKNKSHGNKPGDWCSVQGARCHSDFHSSTYRYLHSDSRWQRHCARRDQGAMACRRQRSSAHLSRSALLL